MACLAALAVLPDPPPLVFQPRLVVRHDEDGSKKQDFDAVDHQGAHEGIPRGLAGCLPLVCHRFRLRFRRGCSSCSCMASAVSSCMRLNPMLEPAIGLNALMCVDESRMSIPTSPCPRSLSVQPVRPVVFSGTAPPAPSD